MHYYWNIVLYFWPIVCTWDHICNAIDDAHMIASNFRRWAWNRMWEIVIVVVIVWTIQNVVEIKTSWHWTIASVKCFIECLVITAFIDILGDISREVISQDQAVLENVLYNLYFAAIFAFYDPKFSAVIIAFVAFWLGELALEIVVDECYSLWHRNDKKPSSFKPMGPWKVAAVLRSSNNGFRTNQFTAVTMCDVDEFEDSFSILVVEVRRRNRIWRSLILWRVSLLDGTQKKINEYQLISTRTIGRPFARVGNDISIESFQSRGLVVAVIDVQSWQVHPVVFLYDQRCGKSASFESRVSGIDHFDAVVDFACLRRDYNADGSIRGWRVRIVDHRYELCDCHPGLDLMRSVLRISTIDFGQKPVLVSQEEIVFRRCSNSWIQVFRSRNLFAIRKFPTDDGPIMMFNRLTWTFCLLPNFNALKRIDRPLALYYYTPTFGDPLKMMGDYLMFPADLTEKGCVLVCVCCGVVIRTDFEPPSMFRGALQALLQSEPSLRIGMSADQFRRLTGIGGMESQF